ncbi:hypothetical protein FHX80_112221 [Streptomyces brevispora]|nr:hypothetical protein [Streptomyces brevispora]TWG03785.1 hypothetical protein FHX80_112221 [Streptomyces brevispora]
MRHVPVFRWVLSLGLVLIGCSLGLFLATPDLPELRQIDLTVLDEKPDGACTVRWTDPFEHREREAPYLCEAERDAILKAPYFDTDSGFGWDTGFVVAEGSDKGELYSLEEDSDADARIWLSDRLLVAGVFLTIVGVVGGNIRALSRTRGANPEVVRRARRLSEAAGLVAQDHLRAVEAVRMAWAPLHRELLDADPADPRRVGAGRGAVEERVAVARRIAGEVGEAVAVRLDADRPEPRTTALIVALRVLVEAGPRARNAAEEGGELAARLEPLLFDAAPAAGRRSLLGAGRSQRRRALAAVAALRPLLDKAEREGRVQQFAQVSVDLLRGPGSDPTGLSAWVDFESRSAEYYGRLAEVTGRSLSAGEGSLELIPRADPTS